MTTRRKELSPEQITAVATLGELANLRAFVAKAKAAVMASGAPVSDALAAAIERDNDTGIALAKAAGRNCEVDAAAFAALCEPFPKDATPEQRAKIADEREAAAMKAQREAAAAVWAAYERWNATQVDLAAALKADA